MVMVEQFVSVYRITNPQLISDCERSSYFFTFYYQCGNAFELSKIFKISNPCFYKENYMTVMTHSRGDLRKITPNSLQKKT